MNTSLTGQHAFLESLNANDYDLVLLQEPHIDHLGHSRANSYWNILYPPGHLDDPKHTRSAFLVNKHLNTDTWKQLAIPNKDITAISLRTTQGEKWIYNIYNDCTHDRNLDDLAKHARTSTTNNNNTIKMIWAGDFNRHHPMWDEVRNNHLFTASADKAAQHLLKLLENYSMDMALPRDIPTLQSLATKNFTRVDNVFISQDLMDSVIQCDVDAAMRPPKTDHFPIVTILDLTTERSEAPRRRNFRATDWEKFNKQLKERLDKLEHPREFNYREVDEAEKARQDLEKAVYDTIEECVPISNATPHSKRWWTNELTKMKNSLKDLQKAAYKLRDDDQHPIHRQCRKLRNQYSQLIKNTKRDYWNDWLQGISTNEIWIAGNIVQMEGSSGGRSRIPELKVKKEDGSIEELKSNEDKSRAFFNAFFPQRTAPLPPTNTRFPRSKWDYEETTDEQIHRIIRKLQPYKASSSGTAPNSVFTHARELLVPRLGPIYRALDAQNRYPDEWKITQTVIIKKPGKPNYTSTNAFRPITLSNGFARVINMCKTEDLSRQAEIHNILPENHIGGRPGRATTDSIHMVVKLIKDAWRRGKVASMLFLDVKGAFPSVAMDVLLWELRKKGVPRKHVEWIKRRNEGRRTVLAFDDYVSQPFDVVDGLDQGDAQSLILYLLYNASVLCITESRPGISSFAFVDDLALAAIGGTFEETTEMLKTTMEKEDGVLDWANSHNCTFGMEKFQLLHASRKRIPHPTEPRKRVPLPRPILRINGQEIRPVRNARFLGVHIDDELRWKEQGADAIAKGAKWLSLFSRLAQPSKGISPKLMRRLYLSIAVPRMLYAADIFLTPQTKATARTRVNSGAIRSRLAAIHGRAAVRIMGGMKSTPHDAAVIHANLLPFHLLVDKFRFNAALRLATLPETHPLYKPVQQAARRLVKAHPTPLHDLMHTYRIKPDCMEKIQAVRKDPRWLSSASVRISETREEAVALAEDTEKQVEWRVYADGSGYEGSIGAAATLYKGTTRIATLRTRLGKATVHTVYEGEGAGILMSIMLVQKEVKSRKPKERVIIGVDNQASIRAIKNRDPHPSHYIWDWIHERIENMAKTNPKIQIHIQWTPGHEGIEGNEHADSQAKRAAQGDTSDRTTLPKELRKALPHSRSACKQAFTEKLAEKAATYWTSSARYRRMERFERAGPATKFMKSSLNLFRKQISIIFQLRMGHAPLAKHLHRINKADSPRCPNCGQSDENTFHFVMMCPRFANERARMHTEIGRDASSLHTLLSGGRASKGLLEFIGRTGRFKSIYGDRI